MHNDLIIIDFFNDDVVLDSFIYDKNSDNVTVSDRILEFFDTVKPTNDINVRIRKYKEIKDE